MPCPNSEEYVWFSPGVPEVRHRLAAVAADVARRYDIDGVHLDRIRYPGEAWSYDAPSRREFGMDPATHKAEWKAYRTALVSQMVKETYDSVQSVKPGLVLSAAVWGVYNDKWSWHTLAGATNLMQDSRGWAKAGYMDVLVPMTYYRIGPHYCSRIDWRCTLDDHMQGAEKATGRQMYIGIDASKGAKEVLKQIRFARSRGATGIAVFSFTDADNIGLWDKLATDLFSTKARVPDMSWKRNATH